MPYSAAHPNPVGNRISSVLPSQSSRRDLKVQCTSTISSRTPAQTLSPADKPPKSSLKCCSTSSDPESASTPARVLGNAALPSSSRKSVRFKDTIGGGELESVCLFLTTGRPFDIHFDDMESETDSESSSEDALGPVLFKITDMSLIRSPHTPLHSNVQLEDLTLTLRLGVPACSRHAQSLLRGTVRVRNLSFEKCVTARFTSDDWTTVSDVCARYTDSYPSAPSDGAGWDRFTFSISLELYAAPPGLGLRTSPRTLLFAVRLFVPGVGEWWDNNGGNNFRVVLAPAATGDQAPGAAVSGATSMNGAPFMRNRS